MHQRSIRPFAFFTLVSLGVALVSAVPGLRAQTPPARFDQQVRTDFFTGFAGNAAHLQRAMEICERVLAENPDHAEALVWHGSGLLYQSGQAFQAGDSARGGELWSRALGEMNRAVALDPDNVAVLIPRGAVLLQATRNSPPAVARPLLEQAVADYEKVLALQASYFATLGDHPKGELLFGLAEGSARLGRADKAREYFARLIADAPGSGQTVRAREFIEKGQLPPLNGMTCIGCHK
jgi:tetratricopeptide (TPR) repeat protein